MKSFPSATQGKSLPLQQAAKANNERQNNRLLAKRKQFYHSTFLRLSLFHILFHGYLSPLETATEN